MSVKTNRDRRLPRTRFVKPQIAIGLISSKQMRRDELRQFRRLELASLVEAITLLLLLGVALPLKHFAGYASAVHFLGPVHGLAFIAFIWLAIQTVAGGGWSGAEILRLFLCALAPFGGFFNVPFLRRKADALA